MTDDFVAIFVTAVVDACFAIVVFVLRFLTAAFVANLLTY